MRGLTFQQRAEIVPDRSPGAGLRPDRPAGEHGPLPGWPDTGDRGDLPGDRGRQRADRGLTGQGAAPDRPVPWRSSPRSSRWGSSWSPTSPPSAAERGASMASLIVCDGLIRRYGDRTVLDGIDLAIAAGRTTVLTGPPESGKSVLLRLLVGAGAAGRWPTADRRRGRRRQARLAPQDRLCSPVLRALPAHDGARQHRLSDAHPGRVGGGPCATGSRAPATC